MTVKYEASKIIMINHPNTISPGLRTPDNLSLPRWLIMLERYAMIPRSLFLFGVMLIIAAGTTNFANAFQGVTPHGRSSSSLCEAFEGTAAVCTGPTCSSKGSKKTLPIFEQMAAESDGKIQIEKVNCVSECAECAMGPNVELRAKGDSGPFYPIKNKVKTEEDVKKVLGLE